MPFETISGLPDNVIGVTAHGKVVAEDYKTTFDPLVDEVLSSHDKMRILYVIASDYDGYSAGGMWQDEEALLRNFNKMEKVAMVSDHDWMNHAITIFGHFIPGQMRSFPLSDAAAAQEWVTS